MTTQQSSIFDESQRKRYPKAYPSVHRSPLGYAIHSVRRSNGWTQLQLAERVGTTSAVIEAVEQGTRDLSGISETMAHTLHLPHHYLITLEWDREIFASSAANNSAAAHSIQQITAESEPEADGPFQLFPEPDFSAGDMRGVLAWGFICLLGWTAFLFFAFRFF